MKNGWYRYASVGSTGFPLEYTISLQQGQQFRGVLVWNSTTSASADHTTVTDELQADLDLRIYDPDNNLLDWSTTWDNTVEIVEITAQTSGNHTLRVTAPRFEGTREFVGVAWYIY